MGLGIPHSAADDVRRRAEESFEPPGFGDAVILGDSNWAVAAGHDRQTSKLWNIDADRRLNECDIWPSGPALSQVHVGTSASHHDPAAALGSLPGGSRKAGV
jgi:hypothetical protein